MPANLTPQYQAAEEAFKAATTREGKLAALEDMLKNIPKHKGTEKMQADLKKRISRMKAEEEEGGRKAGKADLYRMPREGAAQAFLLGLANSGKSSIVGWLTNAKVHIADYPYSTQLPVSGMMEFEDIKIQLVDTPAVMPEEPVPALFANARLADVLILVADLSSPSVMEELQLMLEILREKKVIVGEKDDCQAGITKDRMLIMANKVDVQGASETFEVLCGLFSDFSLIASSTVTGQGLAEMGKAVFEKAGIIRVYAKPPGGRLERKAPFVVKKGACVEDVAGAIHKDLMRSFKSARIWGSSKYSGMSVHRDFIVSDGDFIEFD